jgi:hypothetical protein
MTGLRLLRDIGLGIVESIRESLPTTTDEMGPFVAGMAWATVLGGMALVTVTLMHCRAAAGGC